jgi:hypothetical protein
LKASQGVNGTQKHVFFCEVKCFAGSSDPTTDLYISIGQYLVYRSMLDFVNDSTPLYLAIPTHAYESIFDPVIQLLFTRYKIQMIIVDLEAEVIVEWKE